MYIKVKTQTYVCHCKRFANAQFRICMAFVLRELLRWSVLSKTATQCDHYWRAKHITRYKYAGKTPETEIISLVNLVTYINRVTNSVQRHVQRITRSRICLIYL